MAIQKPAVEDAVQILYGLSDYLHILSTLMPMAGQKQFM